MEENSKEKVNPYREKSIEKIENPEQLNDYLRVTSPGVWVVLAAVIVLLLGVCVWGVFGRIDATASVAVVSREGESICMVPEGALGGVIKNRIVMVDGKTLSLEPSALVPEVVSESTDIYVMLAGKLTVGDIVYPVPVAETLDEGVYTGTVVTETLTPASLFF